MSQPTSTDADLTRIHTLLPELDDIADTGLRTTVATIWQEFWRDSQWTDLAEIAKNPSATQAPERTPDAWTLVTHTRAVARLAVQAGETMQELHGIPFDRDALIALALLHDVSKIVEYEGSRQQVRKSQIGELIQHGVLAAAKMHQHGLPVEMVHGVVAHTPTSNTFPRTHEALIIRYVDFLDTDVMLLDAGLPLYLS